MNLTELRAAHPGLYTEAFEKGREAATEEHEQHLELADAAGSPIGVALAAIRSGSTPAAYLGRYSQHASRSDDTAAEFVKVATKLGLMGKAPRSGMGASDSLTFEQQLALIEQARGHGPSSSSSKTSGTPDNMDLVAAAMNLPAPVATPAGPAATAAQPIDDMDRVAAAMAR